MSKPIPPLTPECDKWGEHHDEISSIKDFIHFMEHIHNTHFATFYMVQCWKCRGSGSLGDFDELVCGECNGSGETSTECLQLAMFNLTNHLCDFYGIDQVKLEQERRSLLDYQRELNKLDE